MNGTADGETDCGSPTGCTDLTTDSNNCGTCGNVCNGTGENGTCLGGVCEMGTPTPTPTPGIVILAPSQVELLGVQIGASQSQVLTLTNEQPGVPLDLTAITFTVTNPLGEPSEWSETDTCGINGTGSMTLSPDGEPGSQCMITVTFTPTVGGDQIASVSVASDYTGAAPSVELIGSAPAPPTPTSTSSSGAGGAGSPPDPVIAPSSINFGSETVGNTSAAQPVTLTNDSQITLTINASPAAAPAPAGVVVTGPFTIATDSCSGVPLTTQGSRCTVTVAFFPMVAGPQTGNLTFNDNAASNPLHPQAVQLLGTGSFATPAPTPNGPMPPIPSISPSSINFETVTVGVSSASHTVTVTNQSQIPLAMASPATSILGPFAVATGTDTCSGATLLQNAKCVVSLTFTPTGPGAVSGSVTFIDNAETNALSSQSVTLIGVGTSSTPVPTPAPAGQSPTTMIVPSGLTFSGVPLQTASAPQAVTIKNTSGSAELDITAVQITSSSGAAVAAQFTEMDNCTTAPIGPLASCTVNVTFTPASAGSQQASLTFVDNVPYNPTEPGQSVTMAGTGLAPSTATPVASSTPPGIGKI